MGPVVVRSFAEARSRPALDSLAVVVWNTHVGGGDVPGLVRRLRAGDFTGGQRPEHFVILLQEVFRAGHEVPVDVPLDVVPARIAETPPSGDRIDIVETARSLSLNVFYVPSMRNGAPGSGLTEEDRGNAILSTLPLDDPTAIELPLERFRRVAIAATLRGVSPSGEAWTLRVCSAHLDLRTAFPRVFESAGVCRKRQAAAIASALPEEDVVLGGDFNTWAPSSIEGALDVCREHFPQTEELDDRPTVSLTLFPDRRLDYLFFRLTGGKDGRYRRLDDRFGSDHFPLVGTVPVNQS